jgi:acyl carrier protein
MSDVQKIRALLAPIVALPATDDQALELESLDLVEVVSAVEARFDFTVRATEVVPENFSTVAAIAAFVARKRA